MMPGKNRPGKKHTTALGRRTAGEMMMEQKNGYDIAENRKEQWQILILK